MLCDYVVLKDTQKNQNEFRLFKEKTVPMFTQSLTEVPLGEPVCDNDTQTDDEQIQAARRQSQKDLLESISEYKNKRDEVANIRKYEDERAILAKRHRIY